MSSNSFGGIFTLTTFGESHGPMLGAVVDGMPAGISLSRDQIQQDLDRRRPNSSSASTARREPDQVRMLSGVFEGITTGMPIALVIENQDARSKDYGPIKDVYRPGHADWTVEKKYGHRDYRGGGRLSGRETVARVAAGAVARRLLSTIGVSVLGATRAIGGIPADLDQTDWQAALDHPLRCPDLEAAAQMEAAIASARTDGDSLGGIVEVRAQGLPAGWGEPVFDKLDARLGAALLSIGAVKGVEIGAGFALSSMRGSAANDAPGPDGFLSNHAGGMLGGISTGEELCLRLAVKPTPSIAKTQQTINREGHSCELQIAGRHDTCIVPRLVAVAEAMTCLVLADAMLWQRAREGFSQQGGTS